MGAVLQRHLDGGAPAVLNASFDHREVCVRVPTAAAVVVLTATAAAAQPQAGVFSASSDLVVLHASVTDDGRYVSGLSPGAFRMVEDGVAQEVRFFVEQDAPVTVGVLIDASGSMFENRDRVVAAVSAFARASHPDDEFFALTFNEHVRAVLPLTTPFTSSAAAFAEALRGGLTARGRTALYDALAAGLDYVDRGSRTRKALIVVSDGGDNASRATAGDVLRHAQASDAVIYTIALIDPVVRSANPGLLRDLAAATGGRSFRPAGLRHIPGTLAQINADVRSSYTLGYVSTNPARDGAFRRVQVTASAADGRRLEVRTRSGYRVPAADGEGAR